MRVLVHVLVTDDADTYVDVGRHQTVLPVDHLRGGDAVTQRDLDLIDLTRAALTTLAADVVAIADTQVVDLRALLEQAAGDA